MRPLFVVPFAVAASAFPSEFCRTLLGRSSVPNVPTSTEYFTLHWTGHKEWCSTPVKTVTPPPVTTTTVQTSTTTVVITAPQNTDTVTTTLTGTETDITTTTITSTTSTETTITSTSTSTVPTPAGFTPISEEPGYVPKKKRAHVGRLAPRAKAAVTKLSIEGGKAVCSPSLYPTAVSCVEVVTSVSYTTSVRNCHKTRTTTLPAMTSTVTSVITLTSTSTVSQPDATSTITASTTVTTTSTSTSITTLTNTETTTATVPGPTVYAACASNNFIETANGGVAISVIEFNNGIQSMSSVDNAYDCCAHCQQTSGCGGSAWFRGTCYLVNDASTCSAGTEASQFQTSVAGSPFSVSNGPCGIITNAGSADS